MACWVDARPARGAGRATKARVVGSWTSAAYHDTVSVMGPTGIVTVLRPRQNSAMSSKALLPVADQPVTMLSAPGRKSTTRRAPARLYSTIASRFIVVRAPHQGSRKQLQVDRLWPASGRPVESCGAVGAAQDRWLCQSIRR